MAAEQMLDRAATLGDRGDREVVAEDPFDARGDDRLVFDEEDARLG